MRLALWERLNTRTGICIGVLNGALYFILISFILFNMAYVTSQSTGAAKSSAMVRMVNQLGQDMQASGFARAASAVASLPPTYYQLADLAGFIVQNPQAAVRLAEYPALTSLWERDDMQALVNDSALTNAFTSGASMAEILENPNVKSFLANKDQTKLVVGILQTNLADLTNYLQTGKTAYDAQKLIGEWEFNPAVTLAWMRQNNPKIPASEMRGIRAWMTQAYAKTIVLATGDNQLFMKNMPKLKNNGPGQPPSTEYVNWKGDWAANGDKYDLHVTSGSDEKFYTATAEDLRLTIKDGKNLLIFDRAN